MAGGYDVLKRPTVMYLTQNFSITELTVSQTAARRGIDNTPPPVAVNNLRALASVLEDVRRLLGHPILISSGYRSPALNQAVGGSINSQHCVGEAADFTCPKFGTPYEVADAIMRSNIHFDQLIYEGTWCHLSISPVPRHDVLTARFRPTRYERGLRP